MDIYLMDEYFRINRQSSLLFIDLFPIILFTVLFQHAFPKEWEGEPMINIQFNLLSLGYCRLIVQDNGIEIKSEHGEDRDKHIGMTLVQILAEKQLNGTYSTENDSGVKVIVTIPLNKHKE